MMKFKKLTREHKKILDNVSFLLIIQLINYAAPLVSLFLVVKIVGYEKLGWITTVQAIMSYLIIVTDYGFSLSATKDISINRTNKQKLTEVYNIVISTKAVLLLITFLVFVAIVQLTPSYRSENYLFWGSFFLVLGQAFFPIWFFQGIEQMRPLAFMNLIARLLQIAGLLIFVQEPSHYIRVNLLQGLGNVIASASGIWYIKKKYDLQFEFAGYLEIKNQLIQGWNTFSIVLTMSFYMSTNILFLQMFAPNKTIVGYYGLAERVLQVVRQLLSVFFQSIYPYVCQKASKSFTEVRVFLWKTIIPFSVVIALGCIFLYNFSSIILKIISGSATPEVSSILQILSIVPFIIAINIPSYQLLLAYEFNRTIATVNFIAILLNIILNLTLTKNYFATGTAWTVVFTELIITLGLHLALETWHSNYSFWRKRK